MKKLFLRWTLINIVSVALFILVLMYFAVPVVSLSVIGKYITGAMFCVQSITAIYCGFICWQADKLMDGSQSDPDLRKKYNKLLCRVDNVSFRANELPFWGLFGAIGGFIIAMLGQGGLNSVNSSGDIKGVIASLVSGIGVAFFATLVGVFFRNILMEMYHLVDNAIEYALIDLGEESNEVSFS